MAAENATLKAEHAALVRFATEVKPQVEGLSHGLRAVPSLLEPMQSQLTASLAETTRHRDAIALLVETVDSISRDAKSGHESLGARVGEIMDVTESRAAAHDQSVNGLGADLDALAEVVRRMEARLDEQQQSLSDIGSSTSSRLELVRSLEDSVTEMRAHTSQANSGLKALRLSVKEMADALGSQRAQTRRALDELEKRSDALARAAAVFSDALKIPNPVSGMGSSLSQLGGALSSRRSSFSVFSSQAETG
jgi:chromosome segregation ATPase